VTTEPDLLAAAFSQARPRLVRVVCAIIGSHSEAEDVVADCWFRLVAAAKDEPVRELVTIVSVTVAAGRVNPPGQIITIRCAWLVPSFDLGDRGLGGWPISSRPAPAKGWLDILGMWTGACLDVPARGT
jgi:hypothetical protein